MTYQMRNVDTDAFGAWDGDLYHENTLIASVTAASPDRGGEARASFHVDGSTAAFVGWALGYAAENDPDMAVFLTGRHEFDIISYGCSVLADMAECDAATENGTLYLYKVAVVNEPLPGYFTTVEEQFTVPADPANLANIADHDADAQVWNPTSHTWEPISSLLVSQ